MSWVAAAAVGGSLVAGAMGSSSAKKASKAQANAANQANLEQRRQFDISRADLEPFRDAGTGAVNRLSHLLGIGDPNAEARERIAQERGIRKPTIEDAKAIVAQKHFQRFGRGYSGSSDMAAVAADEKATLDSLLAQYNQQIEPFLGGGETAVPGGDFGSLTKRFTLEDFEADPVNKLGFQFGLDEGSKAVRRMLGASGMARSGAAVKGLTRFATDYVGSKAGESRNRFVQDQDLLFNRLSGVAGTGQTATTNTAQLGANMATNVGQNIIGAGNARGAAAIAGANAWGNAATNIGNTIQRQYLIDQLRPSTPTYTPLFQGSFDSNFA